MKRSGSNRVARKIGSYDDNDDDTNSNEASAESAHSSQNEAQKPAVVKRPAFGKAKKRSSLRISFGPGEDTNPGDESGETAVVTPKKSNLSRIALEKSARLRAQSPLVPEASRPTEYSKDYIAELRNSTPSTPRDVVVSAQGEDENRTLDIASKFGLLAPEAPSVIPTQAEIQEKKARRRRLAHEVAAHDDDDDEDRDRPWTSDDEGDDEFRQRRNEISLRPKEKYAETRLVHDDEDMAEGFDDFVEDGKISLGRKSEKEARRVRRAEMAELIQEAEGGSEDDVSDDSDEERNMAFAAAQARAGRYGQKIKDEDDGSTTPPRIAPLPDLHQVLEGLSLDIQAKQQRKRLILQKLQELKDDHVRIEERKQYLQEQLQKTGDEYEKLRQDAGLPALSTNGAEGRLLTERGLDSLGTTPSARRSVAESDEE